MDTRYIQDKAVRHTSYVRLPVTILYIAFTRRIARMDDFHDDLQEESLGRPSIKYQNGGYRDIACDNTEPSHPNCWTQTQSRSKKSFAWKINDYIYIWTSCKKKEKFFLVIKKKYLSGNKHFGLFQKILNIRYMFHKKE